MIFYATLGTDHSIFTEEGGLEVCFFFIKNSRTEFCPTNIKDRVNSIVRIILYTNKKIE